MESIDNFLGFFDFVIIFNCFVLEAQMELDKKLGHSEYLLLVKRPFPGSFVDFEKVRRSLGYHKVG